MKLDFLGNLFSQFIDDTSLCDAPDDMMISTNINENDITDFVKMSLFDVQSSGFLKKMLCLEIQNFVRKYIAFRRV